MSSFGLENKVRFYHKTYPGNGVPFGTIDPTGQINDEGLSDRDFIGSNACTKELYEKAIVFQYSEFRDDIIIISNRREYLDLAAKVMDAHGFSQEEIRK